MRHAKNNQRLSRPSEHRQAMVHSLVKSLVVHGQLRTTYARAKVAQRLADRLVTLGKDGSVHARRRAFRVLQDRDLVKQLFGEIAPRFLDVKGGYTRVLRVAPPRPGDGAQLAVLAFSRLPAMEPAKPQPKAEPGRKPSAPSKPEPEKAKAEEGQKRPKFFEGLRKLWDKKKKGSAAS